MISRVGVLSHLRDERHLFTTLDEAIEHARDHVPRIGRDADHDGGKNHSR